MAKSREPQDLIDDMAEPTPEPEPEAAAPSPQEAKAKLAEMARAFADSVADEQESKARVQQAIDFLGTLSLKEFAEMAEHPFVEMLRSQIPTEGLRPGETRHRGTLAEVTRDWTWADVVEQKRVRFTPNESIRITYNGLELQLQADVECEVPEGFYNIYRERREAIRQGRMHEAYMLGHSDQPPHPNWQTAETAEVRAYSVLGRPYGKPGGTLGVGRIFEGDGK